MKYHVAKLEVCLCLKLNHTSMSVSVSQTLTSRRAFTINLFFLTFLKGFSSNIVEIHKTYLDVLWFSDISLYSYLTNRSVTVLQNFPFVSGQARLRDAVHVHIGSCIQ